MKTFRIITAIVLVVGLIGVFSAFGAEQTKTGNKGTPVTDKKESKDQKTAPAPGSTTMQAPAASLQSLPLSIKHLYLKDGTVHVVITKAGGKKLSDKDLETTKLKVEASTLKKPLEWTLLEVDPHKHFARRVRREQDFDTGLAVTGRIRVTATLYKGLWKTAKEETLSPLMAAPEKKNKSRDRVLLEQKTLSEKTKKAAHEKLMLSQPSQGGESTPTKQQALQRSQLAQTINIYSPSGGEVFDWGDMIRVWYIVDSREEAPAGDVTFTLQSPTGHDLATTTHFYDYEPPADLPEDASEWEVEPVFDDDSELFVLGGEPNREQGYRDFEWTLPSGDYAPHGYGFRVVARRGTLFGASRGFTMLPTCGNGYTSASIEPHQAILRQGQTARVVFAFCGWEGLAEESPGVDLSPVYIHQSSIGVDEMAWWVEPDYEIVEISDDRVRGALRVTVPRFLDPGGPYVITLRYGRDGRSYYDTDPFEVAEPMRRSDLELANLFKDREGDIIARVAVSYDLGTVEVPIQVNDRILFATVGPREADVVVGHMDTPAIPLTGFREYCYENWDVTVNPDDRISERHRKQQPYQAHLIL
jgi:hypothetical protein